MGTSNWQNIPFCIEALMKIAPQYMLDIGVGYGRWGMIAREFGEVWFGHVAKRDWSMFIAGVEGFEDNVTEYHSAFYNEIHIGDAREIIYTLDKPWNVIMFGDVLEHFERQVAEEILKWSLEHSEYVLINIPMGSDWSQSDSYENPYEKHLSVWNEEDFEHYRLIRKALFVDYIGRPFGSFVLSRNDPKGLRGSLFSIYTKSSDLVTPDPATIQGSSSLYTQALQLRNEQLISEINTIKNSRSYLFIEKLKASPFAGFITKIVQKVMPGRSPASVEAPGQLAGEHFSKAPDSTGSIQEKPSRSSASARSLTEPHTEEDCLWVEQICRDPKPLSINNPEWRGILASAKELFENVYKVPDDLDEQKACYYAELFRDANPSSITIQGFPFSYCHLVKAIRKTSPSIPIYAIWHGNLLHTKEDYAWKSYQLLDALYREGDIARIGFVKKGMAEVMAASGVDARFVMNLVRRIPGGPSPLQPGRKRIGIWAEPDWGWKKLPYAMLASLSLIPEAAGYVHNVSPRAVELGNILNIRAEYYSDPLPHNLVIRKLSEMYLNMYVSLTECAPMLPLESLSVGSPCLLGPTSHYFLENEFLYKRLVVPYPDNAEIISQYANRAIEERDEIIGEYQKYAPEYNLRALQSLAAFLE